MDWRKWTPEFDWSETMKQHCPHLEDQIKDVEWFASSWSVSELLENNDPDGIVEIVGDWIQENCDYNTDQEWSDLCQVFYAWWGCLDLGSSTPEWDQFWNDKLIEETE